jgi:hypothetical protein
MLSLPIIVYLIALGGIVYVITEEIIVELVDKYMNSKK